MDKILATILAGFIGLYPMRQNVMASFYGAGDGYGGRIMASGQPMNPYAVMMASPGRPLGSYQVVLNPKNGLWVVVPVLDRGPVVPGRRVDLSWEAARLLRMLDEGIAELRIRQVDATSLAIIYGTDPNRRTP